MRAETEGNLPLVMPQGNLVGVLCREVRQGSPGELMVKSSPSRQRQQPCKTNKGMSDEAADAATLTYLLSQDKTASAVCADRDGLTRPSAANSDRVKRTVTRPPSEGEIERKRGLQLE